MRANQTIPTDSYFACAGGGHPRSKHLSVRAVGLLRESARLGNTPNMSTMKAIRFHGNQDLRLDQVPVAQVGADQVKIAPEWCGLCGSGEPTFPDHG
jgi:hypothetical protein